MVLVNAVNGCDQSNLNSKCMFENTQYFHPFLSLSSFRLGTVAVTTQSSRPQDSLDDKSCDRSQLLLTAIGCHVCIIVPFGSKQMWPPRSSNLFMRIHVECYMGTYIGSHRRAHFEEQKQNG